MKHCKRGSSPHSKETPLNSREEMLRNELRKENPQALLDRLETLVETEAVDDIERLSALLDVLDEKAPLDDADMDMAEGLARLKADYAPIFELGADEDNSTAKRIPAVSRGVLKYATAAVITCGIFLTGMVGAQAAGLDIFGALAKWTDEYFHFIVAPHQQVSPYYEPFRQALEDQHMPTELAPSWYPTDAQASDPEIWSDDIGSTVYMDFIRSDESSFKISVEFNIDASYVEDLLYEKDSANIQTYTSNGRTFYIFENLGTVVATWSDETYLEQIAGDLSVAEVKKIIKSIGES